MSPSLRDAPRTVLVTRGYRAPLAIRARDAVSLAEVGDGLTAAAWPLGASDDPRVGRRSPISSLIGFPTLPGLRAQQYASALGDSQVTWPAPEPHQFVVSVIDTLNRYLPQVLIVDAPVAAPVTVDLHSSPARPRPSGWAGVSGEVTAQPEASPAGWSVVQISDGASTYLTVADHQGRFLLYLPYPEALPPLVGDPPVGGGVAALTWQLTVTVRHQPSALAWPANPAPLGPPATVSFLAQAPAQVLVEGNPAASAQATLHFGVPLRLSLSVIPA